LVCDFYGSWKSASFYQSPEGGGAKRDVMLEQGVLTKEYGFI
jgi:hypothetical protein